MPMFKHRLEPITVNRAIRGWRCLDCQQTFMQPKDGNPWWPMLTEDPCPGAIVQAGQGREPFEVAHSGFIVVVVILVCAALLCAVLLVEWLMMP